MYSETKDTKAARSPHGHYYVILGVQPTASTSEIREAYKSIARRLHPDKQNQQESSAFKELQNIYQVLSNEDQRKIYDQFGEEGLDYTALRAINHKDSTAESVCNQPLIALGKQLRRWERKTKKQWFDENFRLGGKTTVGLSYNAAKEILTGKRPLSQIEALSMSQSYKLPLTSQQYLSFQTATDTRNGAGQHSLFLKYSWQYSHTYKFFSRVYFGHSATQPEVGYRATVDDLTSFKQSIVWDSHYQILNMRASVFRRLFLPYIAPSNSTELHPRALHGTFRIFCGLYSGIRTGLRLISKQWRAVLDFLVDPNSIRVFLSLFWANKHNDTRLTFESSLGLPFDWRISTGVNMNVTKETTFGVQNIVSLSNGVEVCLAISRWGQSLYIPISYDLLPNIASATLSFTASLLVSLFFQGSLVRPIRIRKLEAREVKMKEERARRRQLASEHIDSMRWTLKSLNENEKNQPGGGLIIHYAQYGNLAKRGLPPKKGTKRWVKDIPAEEDEEIINVTEALQLLVKNSQLQLSFWPKHVLPGFWDPHPRNDKYLEIFYTYHGVNHRILANDEESLSIPSPDHKLSK